MQIRQGFSKIFQFFKYCNFVKALDKYEVAYYNGYSPIWPWHPVTTVRSEIECATKCSTAKKSYPGYAYL